MKTIIRLSILEMLKKKVLILTLIMSVGFLALYGLALHYTYMGSYLKTEPIFRMAMISQLMSFGVYVTGFIVAFFSVFTSIGAISGEIEQGTLDSILAKPIKRYEIILGRFLGILLVLVPYAAAMFFSIIGLNVIIGGELMVSLSMISVVKSLAVFCLLPLLLTAAGVLFSTVLPTMGAGVMLVLLYFCAMMGGIIEQIGFFIQGHAKIILTNIGIVTSLIMPSDIIYRKASSLLFTTGSGMNMSMDSMMGAGIQPSGIMMVYILIYILFIVCFSMRIFYKKDL